MYRARVKFEWEQTGRLCSMWANKPMDPEDFMPGHLRDVMPRIELHGDQALAALERMFCGK